MLSACWCRSIVCRSLNVTTAVVGGLSTPTNSGPDLNRNHPPTRRTTTAKVTCKRLRIRFERLCCCRSVAAGCGDVGRASPGFEDFFDALRRSCCCFAFLLLGCAATRRLPSSRLLCIVVFTDDVGAIGLNYQQLEVDGALTIACAEKRRVHHGPATLSKSPSEGVR